MSTSLKEIVELANAHKGSWKDAPLAQDIKMFLWEKYDSNDDLIYPNIKDWAGLLEKTMSSDDYDTLNKDEVLSILFGLIHHTRIVDSSWNWMCEQGVTQKLLCRLIALSAEKLG